MTQHIWRSMKYNPLWSKKRKEKIMTVFVLVIAIACTSVMLVASWLPWWWSSPVPWKRRWCSSWWCLPWCWWSLFCARPEQGCGAASWVSSLCLRARAAEAGSLGLSQRHPTLSAAKYTKQREKNNAFKNLQCFHRSLGLSQRHPTLLLQNIQNSERKKTMLSKKLQCLHRRMGLSQRHPTLPSSCAAAKYTKRREENNALKNIGVAGRICQ